MPGISVVLGNVHGQEKLDDAIRDLQSDTVSRSEILFHDKSVLIVFSGNEGYPKTYQETEEYVLCFEGIVYNLTPEELTGRFMEICNCITHTGNVNRVIADFISEADGDFLCLMFIKKESKIFVFNDKWGRLPVFYYGDNDTFVMSREIKFILHFLSDLTFDRMNITQFLMFEYNLGDRTFFSSVHRFLPSHLGIAEYNFAGSVKKVSHNITKSLPLSFDTPASGVSREECLKRIVSLFLESTVNRANSCLKSDYRLIADVSGGFDTRANVTALETLGINTEYYTHNLVTGDESRVAKDLIDLYAKSLKVINASHELTSDEFSDIVYISDCHVNGWTAGTAWKDSFQKRKLLPKEERIANFMGFAGGVLRHPYRPVAGYSSMQSIINTGLLPFSIRDDTACKLTNIPLPDFRSGLAAYFECYPETTLEGCYKHLYFEYCNHLVNAGEDRARRLFWTVQPFWSNELYTYVIQTVPLSHISISFFADIIRAMDEKALTVPLYGRKIDPASKISLLAADIQSGVRYRIRNAVLRNTYTTALFQKLKRKKRDNFVFEIIEEEALSVYRKLMMTSDITSEERLRDFYREEYNIPNAYRVLSMLKYFYKLESMFGNKVRLR